MHEGNSADTIVITINETNADNCVIRNDIICNSVAHNYQQIFNFFQTYLDRYNTFH
jgi:hypothetical protein